MSVLTPDISGLGSSLFARRYLGNRVFFLFLQVLRCFSSLGCLLTGYVFTSGSLDITPMGFSYSEIRFVCLRLNTAFRSLPRPSSALSAKASTACPYLLNLLLSCDYSSFLEVITICSEKFFCVYVRKTHRLSFFHF